MDIHSLKLQPHNVKSQQLIDMSNKESNQLSTKINGGYQNKQSSELQIFEVKRNFKYNLLTNRKQDRECFSFAFNKGGNIFIVADDKYIQVYYNDQLTKMLQKLAHKNVYCLYFMKKSYSFVSGNYCNLIIIWELDANNCWAPTNYLKDHQDSIFSIVMNNRENLLISGSLDKMVKFWGKNNNQWSCNQTIDTGDPVISVSLNEYENKLIVCGDESSIKVIQLESDNTWNLIQKIQVCQQGYRLTFVKGNKFVFQPKTNDFIELFDFDDEQKQFQKLKQINIQICDACYWQFPSQYLKQLNILTVKHGGFLNIFRINDLEEYQKIQTIEFDNHLVFGIVSDDGQFLVSWDFGSKSIQIRPLEYIR